MKLTLLSVMETETIAVIGDEPHPFIDKPQDEEFSEICTSIDRLTDLSDRIEAETVITPALAQEAMQFSELRPALEDEEKKPEEKKQGVLRRVFDAVVDTLRKIFAAIIAIIHSVMKYVLGVGNSRKRGLKATLVKEFEEVLASLRSSKMKLVHALAPTIKADKLNETYGAKITPSQRDLIEEGPMSMSITSVARLLEGIGDPGDRLNKLSDGLNQTYRELAVEANKIDEKRGRQAMESNYEMVVGSSGSSSSSGNADPELDKFKAQIEPRFESSYKESGEIPTTIVDAVEAAKEAQSNLKDTNYVFEISKLEHFGGSLEKAFRSMRFAEIAQIKEKSFQRTMEKTEKGMEQAEKGFEAFIKKNEKTLNVEGITAVNRAYMKVLQRFMKDVKTIGQVFGVVEFGFNNAAAAFITYLSMLVEACETWQKDHPEGGIGWAIAAETALKNDLRKLKRSMTAEVA